MAFAYGVRGLRLWYVFMAIIALSFLVFLYSRLENKIQALDLARHHIELYLPKGRSDDFKGLYQGRGYSQIIPMDQIMSDDITIIYNRVPKTGSTTLMGLAYDLCEINKYHVLHVNISRNNHIMSLADQARFAYNVTSWVDMKPAIYHGHFAFVDFTRFGEKAKVVYINVLRKPLDRLVSYYYFLRYGDDYRPHVVRRKTGDKMTFDECVEKEEADCAPENMWLQIPFICGHASECWVPGSSWALQQAKHNLINNYLLVGVTEALQDFVTVLETTLPRFFKGASKLYSSGKKSHLRKTTTKIEPLPKSVAKIQESTIWKMENEFYEFALEQFHFIRKRTFVLKEGSLADKGQKFTYEKIRPK